MAQKTSAVVLLSGGLDSATTAAIARDRGFALYALTFHYGQRHSSEVESAKKVAQALDIREHRIMSLDLAQLKGSALTDPDLEVPQNRPINPDNPTDIPITYVPARNTVFLSITLAWAEVLGVFDIFIGVNAQDYSGYPDCRPEYIAAFEKMANLATAAAVQQKGTYSIHTPIIKMTKAQIITEGTRLGLDYSLTHSCYNPDSQGRPCGKCDSCILRQKGFREAGLTDPVEHQP